jgi:hypothetical protein
VTIKAAKSVNFHWLTKKAANAVSAQWVIKVLDASGVVIKMVALDHSVK